MIFESIERPSGSPFVKSIIRTIYHESGSLPVLPDGSWDVLIITHRGVAKVLLTLTRPVTSINEIGDELLCISFKPGVYST